MTDDRVGTVSRALHTFHGTGYCSMGKHMPGQNYLCYDEARAVLAAIDGSDPGDYRDVGRALTLKARAERHAKGK